MLQRYNVTTPTPKFIQMYLVYTKSWKNAYGSYRCCNDDFGSSSEEVQVDVSNQLGIAL